MDSIAAATRALARDALKRGGNVMAARVRGGGSAGVLPYGEGEAFYVRAFLAQFGLSMGEGGEFVDAQGVKLTITDDVFRWKNKAGVLKVTERGRERYVLLMADTVKRPDAIYETWVSGQKARSLRRNYVARWADADGREFETLVVFGGEGEWKGVTAFNPAEMDHVVKRAARRGQKVKRVFTAKD